MSRRSALRPPPIHTLPTDPRAAVNLKNEAGLHGQVDAAGRHGSRSSRNLPDFVVNGESGQLSAHMHELHFRVVWLAG